MAKKTNYSKEIEEIKRLKDLNVILKHGDMENALLSNAAKDSETINDNVIDNLLDKADSEDHGREKGLDVLTRLTTSAAQTRRQPAAPARPAGSRSKAKTAAKNKAKPTARKRR